ncbi:MAG: O-antigen ligase family protein [Dehalococcoidia bacterium]|nr:O-antigen ligase family protein [Dehalococcoidia bacterium]
MDRSRTETFVRWGLVAILGVTLLGVYSQLASVSLALQAAVFLLAGVNLVSIRRPWAGSRPLGWAALALAAFMVISAFFSVDRASSLVAFGQWVSYGLTAWLAASVFGPSRLRLLAQYLLLLGVLMAGLAVYFYWGEVGRVALPVMNSIFGNKNHLGGYLLLLLLPVALALFLEAGPGSDRLAYYMVSVLLGSVFVLTYSRGAWFTLAPALALVGWAFRARRAALMSKLALVGIGAALVALLIARGSLGRTLDLGYQGAVSVAQAATGAEAEGTLAPRLDYWQGAVRIMLDHPLTGIGLGAFDAVFPSYQLDVRYYSRFAHDFFLQTGAEAGVAALLASLALFGVLAWGGIRLYRRKDGPGVMPLALRAGLVAGLAASSLHNLVELDWYIPSIALLFAVELGLVLRAGGPEPSAAVGGRGWRWMASGLCALLFVVAAWQWSEQLLLSRADAAPDAATAQAQWEAASALNPLDGVPEFRLAELHLDAYDEKGSKAELDRGIAAAREALARSPARDAYRVVLARLYLSAGKLDQAIGELEDLAQRLPPLQVPGAYRQLGAAYLQAGRPGDAEPIYRRLLAAFPQGPDTPQPPQPGALGRDQASTSWRKPTWPWATYTPARVTSRKRKRSTSHLSCWTRAKRRRASTWALSYSARGAGPSPWSTSSGRRPWTRATPRPSITRAWRT